MPNTRKFKLKRWLAVSAMVTLPYSTWVNAAGLGGMRVLSQMGQPFVAEIELINVSRDEFTTLNARLAPPAAYEAANVRFDPALNTLRLSVERRPNGTPYIRATSARPVTEPYLNLLVDLTSQEGKFQRHYAALLDPPGLADPPATTTAPAAAAPRVETVPPAQKPAAAAPRAPRPAATPAPAPAAVTKAPPTPVAPAVTPAPPAAAPAAVAQAETKPLEATKAEPAKPPVESVATEPPKAEAPAEPASPAPQPQAKPAPAAPLPPPATRGWMDSVNDNLLPLAGGALALLAGLLGLWAWRRRKPAAEPSSAAAAPMFKVEPRHTAVAGAAAAGAAAVASATATAAPAEHTVATVTDLVDAIEEAQVYLDHGRDEQAEAILREALAKQPGREDVQLKLMEVLAARGDKAGFNQLAVALHKQTGGHGERWQRATELGYMLDPTNPLYPATGNVIGLAVKPDAAANVDLDLGSPAAAPDAMSHTTDILLDAGAANTDMAKTMVLTRDSLKPTAPAAPAAAEPVKPLNFDFELPAANAPAAAKPAASSPAKDDHTIDFKVDFPDINLSRDDAPAASASTTAAAPDAQWDEIQQKFDLAHAYQEMGDKEGMLETLQEIVREGNERQKASAQKMIDALK